ncbi:MAG: threonine aldolase family protein, partial [Phycisphaerales bacterium]|nr:threonine aldolase family protein [Phycisphaerales bacterium]
MGRLIADLRSDTVTRPTAAMREAMMRAPLGDDVLGDDPTVNALCEKVCELFGKEAAIFVPSGTMANQVALRALTEPGDEIVCHELSHIYQYEGGAPAALSGCSVAFAPGARGIFDACTMVDCIRPIDDHDPVTKVVSIENTHNRGGGSVWPVEKIAEVSAAARARGLKMHLDGARIMNAVVASGVSAATYARHFDTVTICFS